MKKSTMATTLTLVMIFSLFSLTGYAIGENRDQQTKDIDFTFTQSINSALEPFSFRILGEIFYGNPYNREPRVHVTYIYVSDVERKFIQKIEVDARPRDATEHTRYGLEIGDYNTDGFMDLTIRRFPGEGSNDRTNYYWLWDTKTQRFVYSWRLSEAVTEENLIDCTVTQSVHKELPPLTFRLMGRWVEGWSGDDFDASIHVLQVIDGDGGIIQEFDGLNTATPASLPSDVLHFADYNFDGYLDMALYMYPGGSMGNRPHKCWLWDNDAERFVENEELSDIFATSSVKINTEKEQLDCSARYGGGLGWFGSYKYADGKYILIYSMEWGYDFEIVEELIDDKMVITKNDYED